MMSRASILSGRQLKALPALCSRVAVSTTSTVSQAETQGELFKRPVRGEPGKVRLGFIPEEWFTFFYKKTGVTGPYTFGIALTTYLVSKEIYVLEHEFYTGISLLIICVAGVKMLGPKVAQALDKDIDEYEASWNQSRENEKQMLKEQIADEKQAQWSLEGQNLLVEAKRENVGLQLEAAFRRRVQTAFDEVKKRLDYQVELQNIEKRIAQRNLVDWVVARVKSSITPDQEKQNIDKCIADLSVLAGK